MELWPLRDRHRQQLAYTGELSPAQGIRVPCHKGFFQDTRNEGPVVVRDGNLRPGECGNGLPVLVAHGVVKQRLRRETFNKAILLDTNPINLGWRHFRCPGCRYV
jgi:hypothetical protein